MNKILIPLIIVVNLMTINKLSADEVGLEKIVITPYKATTSSGASATDVLLVNELNAEGIFTLTDAIEDIPSLSYATTGGVGGVTGVYIRGADSSHTQVLLDGINLYDPIVTSAYFYGFNHMSLNNIERVEVSKGPYSSLYGSDSIGGTISLITRKGTGKPKFSFTQEAGSYQTYREKLSSHGKIDKLAYSFAVSKTDINSFYSSKYKNGNHEQDPYRNLNSSFRLDYALTEDIDIGLIADYIYAKYEYDGSTYVPPYSPTDDFDNYARFHQGVGAFKIKQNLTDAFFHKTTFGYTRTYRKGWESATTDNWYNGKTYQAKWQGDYQLSDFDKVICGFDYLRERGESFWAPTRNPNETANTKGYYIENIFTPLDDLFIAASYRLEDHSSYKHHNIFSISGSYLIEQTGTRIKGSFGEGFKAPSLYQLFGGSSGNPNLDPEESESYEAGLEQELGNYLILGSTYFHTHLKNLIDWTWTGPSSWDGRYTNVGKARIYGIENFINAELNDDTSIGISYTHMDTKKLADDTRLLRRPDNKITCKLKTTIDKLAICAGLSYVGNRMDSSKKLKSYLLGNLALKYEVNDRLDAFLRLENMLDKDYELIEGYQTPELSWYLGAKMTF